MMPVEVQPGQAIRPPRVEFEVRAVEAGIVDGKMTYKDVDFVLVTPPGAYSVHEAEAERWIKSKEREPYYAELKRAYEAFKEGKEPPVNGTPIELCTLFSPAQVKVIKLAQCRSVEDLAAWPDGQLGMFGMGAARLKQQAQAWLASAQNAGVAAEQIDRLTADLATEKQKSEGLQDQLRGMEARLAALEGPRPTLGLKKGAA